jgi:hypothetical protein
MRIKKQELIKSQEKAPSSFDLSYTKIWIGNNKELSERVQEKAFQLGWGWNLGGKTIKNTDADSLYFSENSIIDWCKLGKLIFSKNTFKEIFESDLFPEVKEEKQLPRLEKMSFSQQLMSPDELARDLGLVPTEEEIEAWKKEISFWKNETERLIIKFEKASIELQSLKTEMKRKDDYVYDMSFKNQDELDKVVKHYEKLLSEKPLEPTFVPKQVDKRAFTPFLGQIKKQEIENKKPTKYLKLFGYMIYEKN